jgi:hypothetical protein
MGNHPRPPARECADLASYLESLAKELRATPTATELLEVQCRLADLGEGLGSELREAIHQRRVQQQQSCREEAARHLARLRARARGAQHE